MTQSSQPDHDPKPPQPHPLLGFPLALAVAIGLGAGAGIATERHLMGDKSAHALGLDTLDHQASQKDALGFPAIPEEDESLGTSEHASIDAEDLPLEPPTPQEPAPNPNEAPAEVLAKRLQTLHHKLHQNHEFEDDPKLIRSLIQESVDKDDPLRPILQRFYRQFGAGRFFQHKELTELGAELIAFVKQLDQHGLDPLTYELEALETLEKTARVKPQADAPNEALFRHFLQSPGFDLTQVKEDLLELESLPSLSELESFTANFALPASLSEESLRQDLFLAKTFIELTVDFRFVRRASPFRLRSRRTVLTREAEQKELFQLMKRAVSQAHGEGLKALLPPHPQYEAMQRAYLKYNQMRLDGGCEALPATWRFHKRSKGKEVTKLQERLRCEGYYEGETTGEYDEATIQAVKDYQYHHDIEDDGLAQEATIRSMNISISRRTHQLGLALLRMREARFESMGDFFVRINIPSFSTQIYENLKLVHEHKTIVGSNRLDDDKVKYIQGHINRTKLLGTELYRIIVNPAWFLPKRIEKGELKTSLEKDPDYLEKANIKKVTLPSGQEVYMQGSGEDNALGKVKFLLKESNAIYLHDTDKPHLFGQRRRDFSHGCMRVEGAIDFAKYLLKHDGFSEESVEKAFQEETRQRSFDLKRPISTVIEYITVDLDEHEAPIFYGDIYYYDRDYFDNKLPPEEYTLWGSRHLRPRWVPLVDKEKVLEWKKSGHPAPRKFDDKGEPIWDQAGTAKSDD